jgi:hypothetical protein
MQQLCSPFPACVGTLQHKKRCVVKALQHPRSLSVSFSRWRSAPTVFDARPPIIGGDKKKSISCVWYGAKKFPASGVNNDPCGKG